MKSLLARLRRYLPDPVKVDARERARSLLGAMLGVFITGVLGQLLIGSDSILPWLVASMGASAVLLFAMPANQAIVSLVPLFADTGLHHLPMVDGNQRLVGILTQSDLIAALYRSRVENEIDTRETDSANTQRIA